MRDVCSLICLALIGLFRSRASLQAVSLTTGDCVAKGRINARQLRAFAKNKSVSRLPIYATLRRNRRSSPADILDIPVFRRRRPETGFDLHCVDDPAVLRRAEANYRAG